MDKKVLIFCTENNSRSIMAEAILNAYLNGVSAQSAGLKAGKKIHPFTKKVLESERIWNDTYHVKEFAEIFDIDFDMVVNVCDKAQKSYNVFAKDVKVIHIAYESLNGKNYAAFEKTLKLMKMELTPIVRLELGL